VLRQPRHAARIVNALLDEIVDRRGAPSVLLGADRGQDEAQRVTPQVVTRFYGGDDITVETLFQRTG
jgi:hypothetical protein